MPTADSACAHDPELRAERAHLAAARQALQRMREDVLATESPEVYGDWVSTQALRQARALRAEALVDLPDTPPFFGRLDFDPGTVFDNDNADTASDQVRIGRRHIHDTHGHALVLDWRAPMCVAFYRATPKGPRGVRWRRRYGFDDNAELTAFEDEPLGADAPLGERT